MTTIKSPRTFARQLAMITAQQIGPQGSPVTYTHPFTKHQTEHPSVSVFHGPVAYVDDPHTYVSGAANDFERMLRAFFFKHTTYANQREYRFVVWTAAEPQEATVDLQATPEILSHVRTTSIGNHAASAKTIAAQPTDDIRWTAEAQGADQTESAPNEEAAERAVGSPPEASDGEGPPPQPIHAVVSPGHALQSAVTARFAAVIEIFRQTALEEGIPADLVKYAYS